MSFEKEIEKAGALYARETIYGPKAQALGLVSPGCVPGLDCCRRLITALQLRPLVRLFSPSPSPLPPMFLHASLLVPKEYFALPFTEPLRCVTTAAELAPEVLKTLRGSLTTLDILLDSFAFP